MTLKKISSTLFCFFFLTFFVSLEALEDNEVVSSIRSYSVDEMEEILKKKNTSIKEILESNPDDQNYADYQDFELVEYRLGIIPDKISSFAKTKDIVDYSLYEARILRNNTHWLENQWFIQKLESLQKRVLSTTKKMNEIYDKRFQTCLIPTEVKNQKFLVVHMLSQNQALCEKRYSKLWLETHDILKGEKDFLASDLINKNDKSQRRYFCNTLLLKFYEEKKLNQETLRFFDLKIGYSAFCRTFGSLIGEGLFCVTHMKGLARNKMNAEEQYFPQTQPLTFQEYNYMDVTDKVCFSQTLARAELIKDILNVFLPTLEKTKLMVGGSPFYDDLLALYKAFIDELVFFELGKLYDLPEEVLEKVDFSTEAKDLEEKRSKSKKKRDAKKRKKLLEQILTQKQEEEKSPIVKSLNPVVKRKEEAKKVIIEESYFEWYVRTMEKSRPSAIIEARANAKEVEARQQRKMTAKAAKKEQSVYCNNNNNNNNREESVIENNNTKDKKTILMPRHYAVFQEIMAETYTGELEPILNLIQNGFDGFARNGNGSRIRISLRNRVDNNLIANDLVVPFDDCVDDRQEELNTNNTNVQEEAGSSKLVLHRPHKRGSKRLRPEHVKELKNCLERAGYTEETVALRGL